MLLLDGGFSAIYSIPIDANPDKIIRISPSSRVNADIQPDAYSTNQYFTWMDAIAMPNLEFIFEQFQRGYNDAIRCRPKLIAKGLKAQKPQNKLKQHLAMLQRHAQHIFFDVDGLRKQDFSHFLPHPEPQMN